VSHSYSTRPDSCGFFTVSLLRTSQRLDDIYINHGRWAISIDLPRVVSSFYQQELLQSSLLRESQVVWTPHRARKAQGSGITHHWQVATRHASWNPRGIPWIRLRWFLTWVVVAICGLCPDSEKTFQIGSLCFEAVEHWIHKYIMFSMFLFFARVTSCYMPNYGKLCTCASIPSDLWLQGRHPSSILEKEKDDCYTVGVCWWRVVLLRVVNGCCLVEAVVGQRSECGGAHHFRTMWRQNKWLQRLQLFHSHLSTLSHCQLEEAQLRILHITVAWTNKLAFRLFSIFRHGSRYVSCWATQ
jgi:hypothetical protein